MSQNPNSEYKIPESDYNSEPVDSFSGDLKDIYQKIDDNKFNYDFQAIDNSDTVKFQSKTELQCESISKRLLFIADNINKTRIEKIEAQSGRHNSNQRNFVKSIAKQLFRETVSPLKFSLLNENDLKVKESEIGATVFGPKDSGMRREFFNDGADWFFHEELGVGSANDHSTRTLHYEVRPEGVLLVNDRDYLKGEELDKFVLATEFYYEKVMDKVYGKRIVSKIHNDQPDQLAA